MTIIVTVLHERVHSAPAHSALVDYALVRSVLVHCAVETVVVGLEFQVIDELAGTRAAARGPDAHTARGRLSLRPGCGHARAAACLPVARLRRTSDAVWLVSCAPRTLHHRTSKADGAPAMRPRLLQQFGHRRERFRAAPMPTCLVRLVAVQVTPSDSIPCTRS